MWDVDMTFKIAPSQHHLRESQAGPLSLVTARILGVIMVTIRHPALACSHSEVPGLSELPDWLQISEITLADSLQSV